MEIGIIIHWGLYSITAFDDIYSLRRRRMKNGSEWYYKRLTENKEYRPISGYKQTQEYHKNKFNNIDYFKLKDIFVQQTEHWNIENWMRYFKNTNIKYIILTAKHHDGFCLWDTNTTINKSKRNIIKEFIDCCRKNNIKVGIYYSLFEFNKSVTIPFIEDIIKKQIDELKIFNPDIWWFDGNWEYKTKVSIKFLKTMTDELKLYNPKVEINDRAGIDNGTFRNYSDRFIPENMINEKWESINTIGLSWGYNKVQEKEDYKTGKELYNLCEKVKEFNGNFLINFGVKGNGEFDENEINSFNDFINYEKKVEEIKK